LKKINSNEKSCVNFLFYISSVVWKKVLDRVIDYKFFSIMIDQSTIISMIKHQVIFVTFVEEGLP